MAETEQKVDVSRPGSDSLDRSQCGARFVGRHLNKCLEIKAVPTCKGGRPSRTDFGHRKTQRTQSIVIGFDDRIRRVVGHRPFDPLPNRIRTRRRQLLADNNIQEPREACRPATNGNFASPGDHRGNARINRLDMSQSFFNIRVSFDCMHQ